MTATTEPAAAASTSSAAPAPAPSPVASPRAAMAVVRALKRELDRQVSEGTLRSAHPVDANGMTVVDGRLDLAMLAFVAEMALLGHFPGLQERRR
jgi:hypothetical protein